MNDKQSLADRTAGRRLTGQLLTAVIFGLAIWNLIVSVMNNVVTPWLGTLMGQNASLPASFTKNYDYPDLFIAIMEFCIAGIVAVTINWLLERPGRSAARNHAIAPAVPASTTVAVRPQQVPQTSPAPAKVQVSPQLNSPAVPSPAPARYTAPTPRPNEPIPVVPAAEEATAPVFRQVTPYAVVPVSEPAPAPIMRPAPLVAPRAEKPAAPPLSSPAAAAKAAPKVEPPKAKKVEEAKPKKEKQVYYNIVGEPVSFDED